MIRRYVLRCAQQYRAFENIRNLSTSNQCWNSAPNINIFDRVAKQVQKDRAFQRCIYNTVTYWFSLQNSLPRFS